MQPNIEKKDSPESWRNREAATFAFSSILEGPSYASLAGVVNAGLDFLLNATKDPDPMVRQTTAWTIGMLHRNVRSSCLDWCLATPIVQLTHSLSQLPGRCVPSGGYCCSVLSR